MNRFPLHREGTEIQIKALVDAVCLGYFCLLNVEGQSKRWRLWWSSTQPFKPKKPPEPSFSESNSNDSWPSAVSNFPPREIISLKIFQASLLFDDSSWLLTSFLWLPAQCQGPFPSMRLNRTWWYFPSNVEHPSSIYLSPTSISRCSPRLLFSNPSMGLQRGPQPEQGPHSSAAPQAMALMSHVFDL